MRRILLLLPVQLSLMAGVAYATDVPITGLKLVVVDKTAAMGDAKVAFIGKDVGIAKGTGVDPALIAATLGVAYDSGSGAFDMPYGASWLVNTSREAKYVHKAAPVGGAVKVSTVRPGRLVKVVGKSLGDTPLTIASAPSGPVYVADTIVNAGETTRLCTQFTSCVHKVIAGGTGYKLVCRGSSSGDPACTAAATPPIRFSDLGDGTVLDGATGLQWEQKATAVGSGANAADPHDVDNRYSWAGYCSVTATKYCQPNAAAETACKAETDPAHWEHGCEQCVDGEGTCVMFGSAITTVWDWIVQVNAAGYAGHSDWRLPSQSGCNSCWTGSPTFACSPCDGHELETLLVSPYPCATSPCIDPIFGPTVADIYWSGSTYAGPSAPSAVNAWFTYFSDATVSIFDKRGDFYVRAVRGGS